MPLNISFSLTEIHIMIVHDIPLPLETELSVNVISEEMRSSRITHWRILL